LASQRPNGTATEQSFKHTPDAPGIATLKARLSRSKIFQKFLQKTSKKDDKQNPLTALEVRRAVSNADFQNSRCTMAVSISGTPPFPDSLRIAQGVGVLSKIATSR
jgi:hypothetical protein